MGLATEASPGGSPVIESTKSTTSRLALGRVHGITSGSTDTGKSTTRKVLPIQRMWCRGFNPAQRGLQPADLPCHACEDVVGERGGAGAPRIKKQRESKVHVRKQGPERFYRTFAAWVFGRDVDSAFCPFVFLLMRFIMLLSHYACKSRIFSVFVGVEARFSQ
jgi:hypothetical protein